MSEKHPTGTHEAHAYAGPETFDTEINVRASIMTMVWVFGVSLVSALLMWLMMLGFGKLEASQAPPQTPIQAANEQGPPPEPRLERSPYENFDRMRTEEKQQLEHPSWVNREQGVVRLPISEAIDILAERGLPGGSAPVTAPAATGTTQPGPGAVAPDVQPPPPAAAAPSQPPVAAAPPPGGHS